MSALCLRAWMLTPDARVSEDRIKMRGIESARKRQAALVVNQGSFSG